MPAHQLPDALDGVPDVEQLPDQRLDPAESPALVTGEPVGQRAFPQLGFQPRKLLRDKPLPRHRPPGLQCPGAAVPPGPPPPAYRPFGDPQVPGDLAGRVAAGEPLSCLQPQPPRRCCSAGVYPPRSAYRMPRSYAGSQPTSRAEIYEFILVR